MNTIQKYIIAGVTGILMGGEMVYSDVFVDTEDVLKPYFKAGIDSEDMELDAEIASASPELLSKAVDAMIEQAKQIRFEYSIFPRLFEVIGSSQEIIYRCVEAKNDGRDPYITYLTGLLQYRGNGYWNGEDGHGPAAGKTEKQIKTEAIALIRKAAAAGVKEAERFLEVNNLKPHPGENPLRTKMRTMSAAQLERSAREALQKAMKMGYYKSGLPEFFEACPEHRRKELYDILNILVLDDDYVGFVTATLDYIDYHDEMDHDSAIESIREAAAKGMQDAKDWLKRNNLGTEGTSDAGVSAPQTSSKTGSSGKTESAPTVEDRSDLQPLIDRMAALRCREATSALYQRRLLTLLPMIRDGASVDITLPETKGNTALHYSCGIGSWSITKWLVEHGANVNAVTNKGMRPLDCVGADNAQRIKALLISRGAVRAR